MQSYHTKLKKTLLKTAQTKEHEHFDLKQELTFIEDLSDVYFSQFLEKQDLLVKYDEYRNKQQLTKESVDEESISLEEISFKI